MRPRKRDAGLGDLVHQLLKVEFGRQVRTELVEDFEQPGLLAKSLFGSMLLRHVVALDEDADRTIVLAKDRLEHEVDDPVFHDAVPFETNQGATPVMGQPDSYTSSRYSRYPCPFSSGTALRIFLPTTASRVLPISRR